MALHMIGRLAGSLGREIRMLAGAYARNGFGQPFTGRFSCIPVEIGGGPQGVRPICNG